MLGYWVDGINFSFHQGFGTIAAAIAAATVATTAADQGFPSYAAIWSEEDHMVIAVVSYDIIFSPRPILGE